MYSAQYFRKSRDEWVTISARQFDPLIHGKNLRCGDANCNQAVIFRKATTSHGGSVKRGAHFAAKDRKTHAQNGCDKLSNYNEHHNSVTLRKALDDGYPIMFNLNAPSAHPLYKKFNMRAMRQDPTTLYNRWRQKYTHASVSIPSIEDYLKMHARMKKEGKDAFGRSFIGHCQDMRRLSDFHFGKKKQQSRTLFNQMAKVSDADAYYGNAIDFPRYLKAVPTDYERKRMDVGRKQVLCSAGTLRSVKQRKTDKCPTKALILLNSLQFPSEQMRLKFLESSSNHVIATPVLHLTRARAAIDRYEAASSGAHYLYLNWRIASESQFLSTRPTAQKNNDPHPGDQAHVAAL